MTAVITRIDSSGGPVVKIRADRNNSPIRRKTDTETALVIYRFAIDVGTKPVPPRWTKCRKRLVCKLRDGFRRVIPINPNMTTIG